jgi:Dna[CI] antecedent, DciA
VSTKPALKSASLPSYLPLRTVRQSEAVRIEQALSRAPILANLTQLAQQSAACLRLVVPLIPAGMRPCIQAGPLEDGTWCLLVTNSAAAAKLRQLAPALAAHLRTHGQAVNELRIKISMQNSR